MGGVECRHRVDAAKNLRGYRGRRLKIRSIPRYFSRTDAARRTAELEKGPKNRGLLVIFYTEIGQVGADSALVLGYCG